MTQDPNFVDNRSHAVQKGFGVLIKATDMTEFHVGRGICQNRFREYVWLHVSHVTPRSDRKVEIEYLEQKTFQSASTEGNSTINFTEVRAISQTQTFEGDDHVLLSTNPVPRPKGRRIKVVTTQIRTEEPLDD